jgi:hypothetical protein
VLDTTAASAYAGAQFFVTNIAGSQGLEEDVGATGALSRRVETGGSGAPYSSLEVDYVAEQVSLEKVFYTNLTGLSYTSEEVDVSASGQLEKVVYGGMTATPYASLEQDFSGGALADSIYSFTNVTGANYYAYQVEDNAQGAAQQQTVDYNSGAHIETALTSGQTLTALGGDMMIGSGATVFSFNGLYGAATIANFTALQNAATNSGANLVITAADGDTLTLDYLSTTALAGMAANFTFHS